MQQSHLLVKKFSKPFETRIFINVFSTDCHLPLFSARSNQCVFTVVHEGPFNIIPLPTPRFSQVVSFPQVSPQDIRPTPKLEDHPFSAVRDCLSLYSQTHSISGGGVHQQSDRCCGDRYKSQIY
jgi:hypothetical protein